MAIEKKTLPTKKPENKPEASTTKAGKPSTEVGSSEAVTPSFHNFGY